MIIFTYLAYLVYCALALSTIFLSGIGQTNTGESGLLEIAQTAILLLVLLGFFTAHRAQKLPRMQLLFLYAITVLIFAFIGREMSWGRIFGFTHADIFWVRAVWLALILASFTYIGREMWRCRVAFWSALKQTSALIIYMGLGGAWLVLGDMFDRDLFSVARPQYFEEVFELIGYLTFLYCAVLLRLFPHIILPAAPSR